VKLVGELVHGGMSGVVGKGHGGWLVRGWHILGGGMLPVDSQCFCILAHLVSKSCVE